MRLLGVARTGWTCGVAALLAAGCSQLLGYDDVEVAGGSGGATSDNGSGGAQSTGGSGGTQSPGGSGGTVSTGGQPGTGGQPASGGSAGQGGTAGQPGTGGTVAQGGSAGSGSVVPPLGDSSKGSGGPAPVNGDPQTAQGISFRLIVPSTYNPSTATPLLVVYSGTEGAAQMTNNLIQIASYTNTQTFLRAILDGVTYNGDGNAGATVLDEMRAKYNVDNDRTYLMGESAGTTAALTLGFTLRQSYFAAYWANDVNASTPGPAANSSALGFQPWGQAGPGGDLADANAIVGAMKAAGYRVPDPAPYNGAGSTQHGSTEQFLAAVSWFSGKTR